MPAVPELARADSLPARRLLYNSRASPPPPRSSTRRSRSPHVRPSMLSLRPNPGGVRLPSSPADFDAPARTCSCPRARARCGDRRTVANTYFLPRSWPSAWGPGSPRETTPRSEGDLQSNASARVRLIQPRWAPPARHTRQASRSPQESVAPRREADSQPTAQALAPCHCSPSQLGATRQRTSSRKLSPCSRTLFLPDEVGSLPRPRPLLLEKLRARSPDVSSQLRPLQQMSSVVHRAGLVPAAISPAAAGRRRAALLSRSPPSAPGTFSRKEVPYMRSATSAAAGESRPDRRRLGSSTPARHTGRRH